MLLIFKEELLVYKLVISCCIFILEQFDEATIQKILEAIKLLMQIDVPKSKAKVLMLIAELAKAGENKLWCDEATRVKGK